MHIGFAEKDRAISEEDVNNGRVTAGIKSL
jgi:hypothetical protein